MKFQFEEHSLLSDQMVISLMIICFCISPATASWWSCPASERWRWTEECSLNTTPPAEKRGGTQFLVFCIDFLHSSQCFLTGRITYLEGSVMSEPPDAGCYRDRRHKEEWHKNEKPEVVSPSHAVAHQHLEHQEEDMEPHGNQHCFELHTCLPFSPDRGQVKTSEGSFHSDTIDWSKFNSSFRQLNQNLTAEHYATKGDVCESTCTGGCAPRLQCPPKPQ